MDEPYWLLWIAGPTFVVAGIVILFNHQRVYAAIRRHHEKHQSPFSRATSIDTFGDSRSVILPAIFFIPMGLYATFFGLSRFFEWGYV